MRKIFAILTIALLLLSAAAGAQTTITYQGQLERQGSPVDGETVEVLFELHDDPNPGSGTLVSDSGPFNVGVEDGLFQVDLNFGDVNFTVAKYLRIRVDGTWLADTQEITSVPMAQYALGAGGVQWSGVLNAPEFWRLGGNAGTTPGSDSIGTLDNSAFEVQVDGDRALRIEPGDGPNFIAGSPANQVNDGAVSASVAGGSVIDGNVVTDHFGTVAGGAANVAGSDDGDPTSDPWATVGGGEDNTASGPRATVGGGHRNEASGLNAVIGGGNSNTASNSYSTIAGGNRGTVDGFYGALGGGSHNSVLARFGSIGGGGWTDTNDRDGTGNKVFDNYGAIGGGGNNRAGSDDGSTTTAPYATVGGGSNNEAQAGHSTIPGGEGARATRYGEQAYASGYFAQPGDAQASTFVLRNSTTDSAPTELFLDGVGERLEVEADRTIAFEVLIIGRDIDSSTAHAWKSSGLLFTNSSGTNTQFWGNPNTSTIDIDGDPAWDINFRADDAANALVIEVTGALNTNVRWVARVETVEVAGL